MDSANVIRKLSSLDLFVICSLLSVVIGQDTTPSEQPGDDLVSVTSSNIAVSDSAPDPDDVCTNETASAEGLWCYQCEQSYAKVFDEENAVCLLNISQVALRRCGPRDHYCKVERMDLHGTILTIERGCVEDCYYGCRYNGYGLTQQRCTSCCRTPCCNSDNSAPSRAVGWELGTLVVLCLTVM